MSKLFQTALTICFLISLPVRGQEVLEELAQQAMENGAAQSESMFEDLADYSVSPLNINQATREELKRFPFLSDELIERILYYLYKYGPMLTDNELMMVEGMDRETAEKLKPFVCFRQTEETHKSLNLKQILKYGKQELTVRADIPFYNREGFKLHRKKTLEKDPNKQYIGRPYRHYLRYSFRYANRIYAGLTAENDAGEPFFSGKNRKGYDYYSPYLLLHDLYKIKTLVIGNYRSNYGYGLVVNSDFSLGKTASLNTLFNRSTGLKKHSSVDEYNYFQGIGASIQLFKRWTIDAFYSFRKMDGKVDGLCITSLKRDGLHRLEREFERKNTYNNRLIGSHLNYNGKYGEFGLTAVHNVLNKRLKLTSRPYNNYAPAGRDFFNIGLNYKLFVKEFTLSGEIAADKKGTVAALNVLRYSPNPKTQFVVMNRYYDAKYQSLYARSVSEGGTVQNENAFYIGLETKLLRKVSLTAYGDFFYFPWKKYLVSKAGTKGFDGLFQLNYSPSYELNMFIRYKYKKKDRDVEITGNKRQTVPLIQHRLRYQLNCRPNEQWTLKTVAEYHRIDGRYRKTKQGYLVSQTADCVFEPLPLRIDFSAVWFDTTDYDTRIYLYEKSMLYAFSMPSFFYKGIKFVSNIRYAFADRLIIQFKYGWMHYLNRKTIGTGLDLINGCNKHDLCVQVRWKF